MDASLFDRLTRLLDARRSRRVASFLMGGLAVTNLLPGSPVEAKKKKKKCAKKCAGGCCTSKYGKCVPPAEQSAALCGTGGAICQRTGCPACTAARACPTGQCCTGSGTCGACRVFITSATPTGAMGGLSGADAICQSLAAAAGLPGTYLAWLSDASSSPRSRFTQATVPYVLADGQAIADSWSDLTIGLGLNRLLNQTETGTALNDGIIDVWTNSTSQGFARAYHCEGWTSTTTTGWFGNAESTNNWSDEGTRACGSGARLYCFQQQ